MTRRPAAQLMHRCWLAYLSDDLPTDAVIRAHPMSADREDRDLFCASLDHTIWFHRPLRADRWHLHDFTCHHFIGGRGLSIGHVFAEDGTHVATVSQEVLVRDRQQTGHLSSGSTPHLTGALTDQLTLGSPPGVTTRPGRDVTRGRVKRRRLARPRSTSPPSARILDEFVLPRARTLGQDSVTSP